MVTDIQQVANTLKQQVDEHKFIDVGLSRTEARKIGITDALNILKEEGYQVHVLRVYQVGSIDKYSHLKVLVGPEVTQRDTYINLKNVHPVDLT